MKYGETCGQQNYSVSRLLQSEVECLSTGDEIPALARIKEGHVFRRHGLIGETDEVRGDDGRVSAAPSLGTCGGLCHESVWAKRNSGNGKRSIAMEAPARVRREVIEDDYTSRMQTNTASLRAGECLQMVLRAARTSAGSGRTRKSACASAKVMMLSRFTMNVAGRGSRQLSSVALL